MKMEPIILESARKHGIADEDIRHGYNNAIKIIEQPDEMTMWIGPARNAALLEIGTIMAIDFDGVLVLHCMKARAKFLQ